MENINDKNSSVNKALKFNSNVIKKAKNLQSGAGNFTFNALGGFSSLVKYGVCIFLIASIGCGSLFFHKMHVNSNFVKQPALLCLKSMLDEDDVSCSEKKSKCKFKKFKNRKKSMKNLGNSRGKKGSHLYGKRIKKGRRRNQLADSRKMFGDVVGDKLRSTKAKLQCPAQFGMSKKSAGRGVGKSCKQGLPRVVHKNGKRVSLRAGKAPKAARKKAEQPLSECSWKNYKVKLDLKRSSYKNYVKRKN